MLYQISGFPKQVFWMKKPLTKNPEKTQEWYEHLYDTIMKVLDLEQTSSATLLPVANTQGGGEEREHYKVANVGIGG